MTIPGILYLQVISILVFTIFPALPVRGSQQEQEPVRAGQLRETASTHYESGQYQQAIDAYRQAIRLNPRQADLYYELGVAYSSLGRYKEAAESYSSAIRLKSDYAAAYYHLGHANGNLKRSAAAVKAFRQAVSLDPANIESYYGLSSTYLERGEGEKAIRTLEQAIRVKPDDPITYFKLGLIYFPGGPHAEAIDGFSQVIRLDPRYAEAYYHRAYAYLYQGRGDSAAEDAQTYLTLKGWKAEHSREMVIVSHFGHRQVHREADARRILQEGAQQCDTSAWPFPVIEYLRGDMSARRLYQAAGNETQQCEARAYIGMKLSLSGSRQEALPHLRWVADRAGCGSLERSLAASETDRIRSALVVSSK